MSTQEPPLLAPGKNYFFRLQDSYEFEAKVIAVEDETKEGRPAVVIVDRGIERGWVNVNAISVVWERPS